MPNDFYLICGVILIAAGTLVATVWAAEYFIAKGEMLPPPLRMRKIRKNTSEEMPCGSPAMAAVRKCTVYPDREA